MAEEIIDTEDLRNITLTEGDTNIKNIRYNNPGNLEFRGQEGATLGRDGRFASFDTFYDGYMALLNDIELKQQGKSNYITPDDSLRQLIEVWAPPHENDTNNYADFVSKETGISLDTPIRFINARDIAPYIARQEGVPKDFAHSFAEKERSFYEASQEFTEEESAQNYYREFLTSNRYREILKGQGYEDPNKVIEERLDNMYNTESRIDYFAEGNVYYGMPGTENHSEPPTIEYDPVEMQQYKLRRDEVVPHEIHHSMVLSPNPYTNELGEGRTSDKELDELYYRNRQTDENFIGPVDIYSHDVDPYESQADINAMRYRLYKEGIYDPKTEDFKKEYLDEIEDSHLKERLKQRFGEEDLEELMNSISQVEINTYQDLLDRIEGIDEENITA